MPEDPAPSPERETSVDVFEHEIEELEQSVFRENKTHPLIVVAGAAVIALCLGGGFLFLSSTNQRRDQSSSTIMNIDVREPRSGRLSARPVRFAWESTAGTKGYLLTVREQGSDTDLIIRETSTNWIELPDDEAARIVRGGSYVWRVLARSDQGWTVGEGGGYFSF